MWFSNRLRAWRALRRARLLLAETQWFDAHWYAQENPACGTDPILHYCRQGWREGRDPGPDFSTTQYLQDNPDVAASGINPLFHFLTHGHDEGRNPAGLHAIQGELFPRVGTGPRFCSDNGQPRASFIIDLVQDVGVLRPLLQMAARDFSLPCQILVSGRFIARDKGLRWQKEVMLLAQENLATVAIFGTPQQAADALPLEGVVFSASESDAPPHATCHAIFAAAPPALRRVTVQHGFECVGFRHGREHDAAHGPTARFNADLICSWFGPAALTALDQDRLNSLRVTGPTMLLNTETGRTEPTAPVGLISENLHSVRFQGCDGLAAEFVAGIAALCRDQGTASIALRPHPGGRFASPDGPVLPDGLRIADEPIWRLGLERYAYAISSPSSFVIDAILAGIPTAVWQDRDVKVDTSAFAGLPKVCEPDDWTAFAHAALANPDQFRHAQQEFLRELGFIADPAEVYDRYSALFREVIATTDTP